jgi:hypothetical protein
VLVSALGEHPHVLGGAYEAPLYERFGNAAFHYACGQSAAYVQENTCLSAEDLRDTLKALCFDCMWGAHRGLKAQLARLKKGDRSFLSARCWAAKAFPPQEAARGLLWLFPKARFVYVYRNGIDVVTSMRKFGWWQTQAFRTLCDFWASRVVQYRYLTVWDNALTVRQEDLLNRPEQEFARIQGFLGVALHPGPAHYAQTTLVHPLGRPSQKTDPRTALSARRPGYETWTPEERSTFKHVCSSAMRELEYEIPF